MNYEFSIYKAITGGRGFKQNNMQHSVKEIGNRLSEMSALRQEKELFKADDFFNYAKNNSSKYQLIENGDDYLVSTWNVDELKSDFLNTTKTN